MSPAKQSDLLARAQAGDADAARSAVMLVRGWCFQVAVSLHRRFPAADRAELAADALAAVGRSIPHYDPAAGVTWVTYAATAARREAFRTAEQAHRRVARFKRETDPLLSDPDSHPAPDPPAGGLLDAVRAALEDLDPAMAAVVRARFGLDAPRETVARLSARLGLPAARINALYRAAILTLRERHGYNLSEGDDCPP